MGVETDSGRGMERARPEIRVRSAAADDLDELVELFVDVAAEGRWVGSELPIDRDQRRRRWAESLPDERTLLLVAEAGGHPIGQLWMDLARYGVAELGMLVSAGYRGRGVGSALLTDGIAWAHDAGAHKITLQVWPHNLAAIGLYKKFGFEREGRLRRHYRRRDGELWDAIVMGLLL